MHGRTRMHRPPAPNDTQMPEALLVLFGLAHGRAIATTALRSAQRLIPPEVRREQRTVWSQRRGQEPSGLPKRVILLPTDFRLH
jgi:hypothetical protein